MATASHHSAQRNAFRRLMNWLRRRPLLIGVTIIALVTLAASAYQNGEGRASSTSPQVPPTASSCADGDCSADGVPLPGETTQDLVSQPPDVCEEADCPQPGNTTAPEGAADPPSTTDGFSPAPGTEAPPNAGPRSWPLVKSGAQGHIVAAVQLLLTAHGYPTDADASFGAGTTARVRSFQRDRSLASDGIVGPDTWHALIINVRSGDRGPAVTAVQRLLAVHGHLIDKDGSFGTSTARAVGAFQQEQRLATDSVVGPDTWAALLRQA